MMYEQKHQSRLCATKSNHAWLVRSVLFQNKIWKINLFLFEYQDRTEQMCITIKNYNKKVFIFGNGIENLENNQFSTLILFWNEIMKAPTIHKLNAWEFQ